jgi:hypothetical protein
VERQRDLVLRWIEQIAQLVARAMHGGQTPQEELVRAREKIAELTAGLLGGVTSLVPRMAVESAAALIPDPDRLWQYAELLDLDAAVLEALGELEASARMRTRAVAFARVAATRVAKVPPDWERWLAARAPSS